MTKYTNAQVMSALRAGAWVTETWLMAEETFYIADGALFAFAVFYQEEPEKLTMTIDEFEGKNYNWNDSTVIDWSPVINRGIQEIIHDKK